jgi:hypothetical protein
VVNVFLGVILAVAITAPPSTTPAAPDPVPSPSPTPSPVAPAATVEDLYRAVLPAPIGESEPAAVGEVAGLAPGTSTASADDRRHEDSDGLYLGRVKVTPSFHASYVNAEGALFDTARPVKDQYYELRPQVGAEYALGDGFLRGAYQMHIRRGSSFNIVDSTTSHLGDLSLQLPLGAFAEIVASEHYAHGVLEAAEVDPGREYFFGLGRFTRHVHSAAFRLTGGRGDAAIGGSLDDVRVDERSTFFDHEQQNAFGQLGYEVRPDVRAAATYSYTRIPASDERPEVESELHSVAGELRGEILPLTRGALSAGYFTQSSPNAGPGGTSYSGLTLGAELEKSFTPSTSVLLTAARGSHASGFEENAFYIASSVAVLARIALPWSFAGEAGAGYHRNDYRTIASSIDAPRRDSIRGVTFGLARPVTRHAYVRADYRRDRRDSNIDTFDSTSNVLTVQLGIGLFAGPPPLR